MILCGPVRRAAELCAAVLKKRRPPTTSPVGIGNAMRAIAHRSRRGRCIGSCVNPRWRFDALDGVPGDTALAEAAVVRSDLRDGVAGRNVVEEEAGVYRPRDPGDLRLGGRPVGERDLDRRDLGGGDGTDDPAASPGAPERGGP